MIYRLVKLMLSLNYLLGLYTKETHSTWWPIYQRNIDTTSSIYLRSTYRHHMDYILKKYIHRQHTYIYIYILERDTYRHRLHKHTP